MNGKTYAYLDIAVQPAAGALLLDPRPAFAFRGDGSGVLFANAAGVSFFGEPGMSALLSRRFAADSSFARQLSRLSKQLPVDHDRLEILRFNFGVKQVALPAACRRLVLPGGGHAVLAVGSAPAPRESLSTRAERLADTIAAEDCLVALLDADGKVLGASGGFDALAPASAAIDRLVAEVARADRPLLKRPIEAGGAPRPAGVARIAAAGETLFLLIVGPEQPGLAEPQRAVPPAVAALPAAAMPSPPAEAAPLPAAAEPSPALAAASAAGRAAPEAEVPPEPVAPEPAPLRRFLWQVDAAGRFAFVSPELAEAVGAAATPAAGESWAALADRLGLDAQGRVAAGLAARSPWSGITLFWPLADTAERVAVELSALPVTARDRAFAGYRGFGLIHVEDRRADTLARPLAPAAVAPVVAEVASPDAASPEPPAPTSTPALAPETPVADAAPEPEAPIVATIAAAAEVPPSSASPAPVVESVTSPEPPDAEGGDDLDDVARKIVEEGHRPTSPRPAAGPAEMPEAPPAEPPPAEPPAPPPGSNVVPLPGTPTRALPRRLSGTERDAFRRIAEALGARSADAVPQGAAAAVRAEPPSLALPEAARPQDFDARLLEKLPIGLVVTRDGAMLFANRAVLDLLGYETIEAFAAAGGVEAVFRDGAWSRPGSAGASGQIEARRADGTEIPVEAKLHAVNWAGATALRRALAPRPETPPVPAEAGAKAIAAAQANRIAELEAILDTATDGVVVIDRKGRIASVNHAAEALFGVAAGTVAGKPFTDLLAEESRRAALDYLDGLAANGVASVLNDGREVIGRVPTGGLIPLFMTMGRLGDSGKYCAVLRDITHWKNVEAELVAARRAAEAANQQKSDFLAKISHEIRTPLNAIIGFSEVMMEERFGPIGSDRYRAYLRDIHVSGAHLLSLINDLLDLSKIEAGKLELKSEAVAVNEVIQECVGLMQPQANRERIIIRTSLGANIPNVVADPRSLRQILLNLLSNAVKFTRAGGQVIVATALEDSGEVVVRIRDTGIGMSEKDIETAMKPFRQVATSGRQREGTGLGLPLTKALVEANRASFAIDSVPNQGTLVRITFPTTRVLAG